MKHLISLVVVLAGSPAYAGRHHTPVYPVSPDRSFVCMSVAVPASRETDGNDLPRVLAAPDPKADPIALAAAITFVHQPQVEKNGFVKVSVFDRREGWLPRELLSHYHSVSIPNAKCTPMMMSNGTLGIGN